MSGKTVLFSSKTGDITFPITPPTDGGDTPGTLDNTAIGTTTPAAINATTLTATETPTGAGIVALFASPPAIGGTVPVGVAATTLSATGLTTLAGVGSSVPQHAYNTNTNASGAVTLTAAECTGGSVETWVFCTGTQSGAFNIDLPTVASLVTAMQDAGLNPVPGGTFILNIANTCGESETGTITTATGWTLTGTMTATENTYRKLLVTITSLAAFAAQSLGEYTITGGV